VIEGKAKGGKGVCQAKSSYDLPLGANTAWVLFICSVFAESA